MSELVERLRERALELHGAAWSRLDGGQDCTISAALAEQAADRIETLERALQRIIDTDQHTGTRADCISAPCPLCHPIAAVVRPINERLFYLCNREIDGTASPSEITELNALCAELEQGPERRPSGQSLRGNQ